MCSCRTPSCFDREEIAKLEEESIIIDKALKAAKLVGIKKLRLRIAESVSGLSEKRVS